MGATYLDRIALLDKRANRLAHYFQSRGIGAGDRVDLSLGEERTKLIRDAAGANDRTIIVP